MKFVYLLVFALIFNTIEGQSRFEYLNDIDESGGISSAVNFFGGYLICESVFDGVRSETTLIVLDESGENIRSEIVDSELEESHIEHLIWWNDKLLAFAVERDESKDTSNLVVFEISKQLEINKIALFPFMGNSGLRIVKASKSYSDSDLLVSCVFSTQRNSSDYTSHVFSLDSLFILKQLTVEPIQGFAFETLFNEKNNQYVVFTLSGHYRFDRNFDQIDGFKSFQGFIRGQGSVVINDSSNYVFISKRVRSPINIVMTELDTGLQIVSQQEFGEEVPNDVIRDFPAYYQSFAMDERGDKVIGGMGDWWLENADLWTPIGRSKFMLVKLDEEDNHLWTKYYKDDAFYSMFGVLACSDGGYLMYGFRYDSENDFSANPYALKVGQDGNFIQTSIDRIDREEIEVLVSPNPSSGQITIQLTEFEKAVDLRIELVSMSGKLILTEEMREASKKIDVRDLPTATYLMNIYNRNGQLLYAKPLMKK